jgi:sulfite exporter TauE/SafE
MDTSLSLLAAFSVGFLGSLHCVGMCGGISAALGQSLGGDKSGAFSRRLTYQFLFSGGRIGSYMLAGLLAASLGEGFRQVLGPQAQLLLRSGAGLMLIALGLYLSNLWRGLSRLEQLGSRLWKHLSPFSRHLLPVTRPSQALALGALWGWLPCGLVYSALSWSIAAPSPLLGALTMGYFGLGTLPAMLGVGLFSGTAQALLRAPALRWTGAALLIVFGLWTLASPWMGGHGMHG